jgi:hypothetical protein
LGRCCDRRSWAGGLASWRCVGRTCWNAGSGYWAVGGVGDDLGCLGAYWAVGDCGCAGCDGVLGGGINSRSGVWHFGCSGCRGGADGGGGHN